MKPVHSTESEAWIQQTTELCVEYALDVLQLSDLELRVTEVFAGLGFCEVSGVDVNGIRAHWELAAVFESGAVQVIGLEDEFLRSA